MTNCYVSRARVRELFVGCEGLRTYSQEILNMRENPCNVSRGHIKVEAWQSRVDPFR